MKVALSVLCILLALAAGTVCAQDATYERLGQSVVLKNAHCRLELDARTGGIVALTPGPTSLQGDWLEVVQEDRAGLEPWETWQRGQDVVFSSGPVEVSGRVVDGAAGARMLWQRPNGLRIVGQVELGAQERGPRFRVTVENTTGRALVDTIRLPVLRGIELGDAQDDWFTWPHTLGARFRVRGFKPGQELRHAYPDFMYMQWLDLHDAQQGVYIGCLDDYGYCKELFIGRDDEGRSLMGVSFVGCWIAKAKDSWTTPWVQVVAHEGDWRAGADLYRPFAETAFGPLDPPQRVLDMPTAQCWLAHHASDGDIGDLFEIQQQAPIHASYLMKSLNTSIPEGWDGFRGSALELHEAFAKIKRLGGSPALFTFDRAPLMGHPNYAEHVGRWTSQRRDRSFAEGFRDMMPSPFDPDYVRARVGEAVRWVQAFGIDEIHFDTAATTSASLAGPSYHPGTPQRPNEVPHYFKKLYRSIRDACREHMPGFILRAEHCADFFYPEFLTSTAHFFETGTLVKAHNPPEDAQLLPILLRYTLPHHAGLQMPSMSANDFWTYGYGMGHGFHGGGPSWCFNPGVRQAESPPGELLHRYRLYAGEWRKYYDFRVGLGGTVVQADGSDVVAEALIDGQWRPCGFPGPLIAVTHYSQGAEVTLGQWFHLSHSKYFGERFIGQERMDPQPVRLRVPTRLRRPRVRLWGEQGEPPAEVRLSDGVVQVEVQDPTCFALEVSESPLFDSILPPRVTPGEVFRWQLSVTQDTPRPGEIVVTLPAGWQAVDPISVPARATFECTVEVRAPQDVFGRYYPLKAVFRSGGMTRTAAGHVLVMEPMTVLYAFDALEDDAPTGRHCVQPGKPARLTVTCVNNTSRDARVEVVVSGTQVSGRMTRPLAGVSQAQLGDVQSPLGQWVNGKGEPPNNALVSPFDFDCTGVPTGPVSIEVRMDGSTVFRADAYPRTRIMDLNGEWKTRLMPRSRARVGGAERLDSLDTEAVTPDVWDGDWPAMKTPIRLDEDTRQDNCWGIYRRTVYLPDDWRGVDIWLRLTHMGAPWGHGGTLNLVYVNGWPAGRVGTSGECSLTPFLVFGGWNLIAVASMSPNSLVAPYLFVRDAPAPERIQPAKAPDRPQGAFLTLGRRPTGQGLGMVFIQGVIQADHRRTDIAKGGEHRFIYFTIADAFLREPEGPVEIAIEYLDESTAPFGIAYDSTDPEAPIEGAFKDAPPCMRTDTGQWRTHVFVLADARLANREHLGADFRLWAREQDVHVRRVEVRLAEAAR